MGGAVEKTSFVVYLVTASDRITANVEMMVKVKVKFTLEQATKAHRGSRGIALLFL